MKCSHCGGTIIPAYEGPVCINCGRPPRTVLVSVNRTDDERCEACSTLLPADRPRPRKERRRFCDDRCRVRAWTRKKRAA